MTPREHVFDLASRHTGRTFRVFTEAPGGPAPERGWPSLTLTDGNATFPLAAATARLFSPFSPGMVVVGVGYPSDDLAPAMAWRTRDLTPPTPEASLPRRSGQPAPKPEDYGGAEAFARFLAEELRPAVEAAHPIDPDARCLYGHSLGGLFTLGVMLDDPSAYARYVVSSPSVWWDGRAVLRREPEFARKIAAGARSPRVLVCVGELEDRAPARTPPGMSADEIAVLVRDSRMVDNARELAGRLAALPGPAVAFHVFQGEDHVSVIPASVSRAVMMTLDP